MAQGDDWGMDLEKDGRWIDEWEASIEDRATKAKTLSSRLAALTATVHSGDGRVEVTVAANGAVTALRLDDSIRAQPVTRMAALILDTIRSAQSELAGLAGEAVAQTVGLASATGQAVLQSFAAQDTARDHLKPGQSE